MSSELQTKISYFLKLLDLVYDNELKYKNDLIKLINDIKNEKKEILPFAEFKKAKSDSNLHQLKEKSDEDNNKIAKQPIESLIDFYEYKSNNINKGLIKVKELLQINQKFFSNFKYDKDLKEITKECNFLKKDLLDIKNNYNFLMNEMENDIYEIETIKYNSRVSIDSLTKEILDKKKEIENKIDKNKINVIEIKSKYMEIVSNAKVIKENTIKKIIPTIENEKKKYNINEYNIICTLFNELEKYYINMIDKIKEIKKDFEINKKEILIINEKNNFDNLLKNLNFELLDFEEYKPKHCDLKNEIDLCTLQELNIQIGFEIDKCFVDSKQKKEMNFILLINKIKENFKQMRGPEITTLKKYFFENEEYIIYFLQKVNNSRGNVELFNDKDKFNNLIDILNYIISIFHYNPAKNHLIIKLIFILSQTFYFRDANNINNKIFVSDQLKLSQELISNKFWENYIQHEIDLELEKHQDDNISYSIFIILLSNTRHLNDFVKDKNKSNNILNHFFKKYKISEENIDIIIDSIS